MNEHWRTRSVVIAGIVTVLVIASLVVWLILGGGLSSTEDAPAAQPETTTVSTSPGTLLLQATDEHGVAVANALLGTGGTGTRGAELLLPAQLLVPAPSPVTLAATAAATDTLQARNGATSLLGVRIDASVVLDRLALAALVDGVGGVPLSITEPVQVFDAGGRLVQVIPAGPRVLDGVTASTYALTLQPGESETARMRRFRDVLDQVLRALPGTAEGMRQLVLSLGSLAKSTATNDELVAVLSAIQADAAADAIDVRTLPTLVVRADRAAVMQRPEGPSMAARMFPEALMPMGTPTAPVVQVWAAGASGAQAAAAVDRLQGIGVTPVPVGRTDAARTRVLLPDRQPDTVAFGTTVAQALGRTGADVVVDRGAALAGVVQVLIGSDLDGL